MSRYDLLLFPTKQAPSARIFRVYTLQTGYNRKAIAQRPPMRHESPPGKLKNNVSSMQTLLLQILFFLLDSQLRPDRCSLTLIITLMRSHKHAISPKIAFFWRFSLSDLLRGLRGLILISEVNGVLLTRVLLALGAHALGVGAWEPRGPDGADRRQRGEVCAVEGVAVVVHLGFVDLECLGHGSRGGRRFEPKAAQLPAGGSEPASVHRKTGSVRGSKQRRSEREREREREREEGGGGGEGGRERERDKERERRDREVRERERER